MSKNQICSKATGGVAEALKVDHSLHTIDLNYNRIGAEGAGNLSESLTVNRSLHAIYLSGNKIGAKRAVKIATALKVNQSLQTVDLQNNNRSWEVGRGLASQSIFAESSFAKQQNWGRGN